VTRFVRRGVRLALAACALVVGSAWAGDEVPFITTPDNVTLEMLQAAGVRANDHVIDLGSGDGRIVITAALRFGASGLGVDIDPALVERSAIAARRAGVAERVSFRVQDLFETDLSRASVITMYLLPEFNMRLRPRLLELAPGTRIVSHDWDMGDWQPDRSRTVDAPDKTIGREKKSSVLAWVVPARVAGTWCAGRARLEVTQRFQKVSSVLVGSGSTELVFDASFDASDGVTLKPHGQASAPTLRWSQPAGADPARKAPKAAHDDELRVIATTSSTPSSVSSGAVFRRAPVGGCV
jgi:SAM-dependent methyltransferase